MYIYRLRQKSSGLFFSGEDTRNVPRFNARGKLYQDKTNISWATFVINEYRQLLSRIYHSNKSEKHAEEAKLLRPTNFEIVHYFCEEVGTSIP